MKIKRFLPAASAVLVMLACAVTAFADANVVDDTDSSETTTSVSETTAETQTYTEEETTTTTITTTPEITTTTLNFHDTGTLAPTKIWLDVGKIKDQKFKVDLKMTPQIAIIGATIEVQFDSELFELKSSEISEEMGGMAIDKIEDGVYTFTYIDVNETMYDGTYATLNFKLKNTERLSSVIYISVISLEDSLLHQITPNIHNGIVNYEGAVEASAEIDESDYIEIKLEKTDKPVTLESLGIKGVESVKLSDEKVVFYQDEELTLLKTGQSNMIVTHNDEEKTKSYYRLVITEPVVSQVESAAEKKVVEEPEKKMNGKIIGIIIVAILGIAVIVVEYIVIVKPFNKTKKSKPTIYEQDLEDEEKYDEYDDVQEQSAAEDEEYYDDYADEEYTDVSNDDEYVEVYDDQQYVGDEYAEEDYATQPAQAPETTAKEQSTRPADDEIDDELERRLEEIFGNRNK